VIGKLLFSPYITFLLLQFLTIFYAPFRSTLWLTVLEQFVG